MCLLEKFLCCCELETGGLIIGWFNLICSTLFVISQVLSMIGIDGFYFTSSLGVTVPIFFLILNVVMAVISYFLIKGVQTRNAEYVKIALIFFAINWILSVIAVTSIHYWGSLGIVIFTPYCLWTLYSLYVKF